MLGAGAGRAVAALTLMQCVTARASDEGTAARITAAVAAHLSAGCTYIIGGQRPETDVVRLQKQLSKLSVQASVVTARQFSGWIPHCRGQRTLCVLPHADNLTPSLLEQAGQGLRQSVWLLLSAGAALRDVVGTADVPLDSLVLLQSPGATELREVYRVAPHLPLVDNIYAVWGPEGLRPLRVTGSIFHRGWRLHDLELRVTAHRAWPIIDVRTRGNSTEVTNYVGAVWDILQHYMGFRWRYVNLGQDEAGSLVNGSWTGCLGAVARGDVDVVLGVFLATARRQLVADFLHDTWQDTYVIYTKAVVTEGTRYLSPFSTCLWWAVLGFVLLCGGLTSACRRCGSPCSSLLHAFVLILCSRELEEGPSRSGSQRLLELAMTGMGLVLLAAYSSQLVSYIAVMEYRTPFRSLDHLLADGSYTLVSRTDCPLNDELMATRNPVLREMYRRVFVRDRSRRLAGNAGNLRRLCRHPKSGFIVEMFEAEQLLHKLSCRVVPVPQRLARASGYLLFAKNLPFNKFFKLMLQTLESSGVLNKLRNDLRHWRSDSQKQGPISVTLEEVRFLYSLLALGAVLSFALLLLELLLHARLSPGSGYPPLIPYTD